MNYDQKSQDLEKLLSLSKSYMDVCKQNKLLKDEGIKTQFKKMQTLFKIAKKAQKQLIKLEKFDEKIEDVIKGSDLTQKVKNYLLLLTNDLPDSKETLAATKKVIKTIAKFFKENSNDVSKDDLIGISLKVLKDKKLGITKGDLDNAFDDFKKGELIIKEPSPRGTGAKIKYVPLAKYQKILQEKLFTKGMFSEQGWLQVTKIKGQEIPFRIKASVQLSGDFAFTVPPLSAGVVKEDDDSYFESASIGFLRQTTAFDTVPNQMTTGLTLASGAFTLDLGFVQLTFKADVAKWGVALQDPEGKVKFEPIALTAQAQLTPEQLDWWEANIFGKKLDLNVPKCSKVAISIKFTCTVDALELAQYKIKDAAEAKLIQELREKAAAAVKEADKLTDYVLKKGTDKQKEVAAKAIKKSFEESADIVQQKLRSKAAKELGGEIVEKAGNAVMTKIATKLGTKILLKIIPGLNVISTVYDAVQLGIFIYDYYKLKPLSPEELAKMEERRNREAAAKKAREREESQDRKKQGYIILKVFSGVPDDGNGMYASGMFRRFDAYLKFYENSKTYKHYLKNKSDYNGLILDSGEVIMGSSILIGKEMQKEYMTEQEAIEYKREKGQGLQLGCFDRITHVEGYQFITRMIGEEVSGKLFRKGDRVPN